MNKLVLQLSNDGGYVFNNISNAEICEILADKFKTNISMLMYDSLSEMNFDGELTIGESKYNFNINIYEELEN